MKKERKKNRGRELTEGGWIEIREILSTATSTQSSNHNTNKKKDISKQLSKQAIRQGKLREITKRLLTRFS